MVPPHDLSDAGACLSDRGAQPHRGRSRGRQKKAAEPTKEQAVELLPLTVPEVRRLLWGLVWGKMPSEQQIIAWSEWRRRHQAKARRSHYKRRWAREKYLQL